MGNGSIFYQKFLELQQEFLKTVSHIEAAGLFSLLLLLAGLVIGYLVCWVIILILCARIEVLSPMKKNLKRLILYLFFYIFWNQVPGGFASFLSHVSLFIFFFKLLKLADYLMMDVYYARYSKKEVLHIFRDIIKGGIWALMILMMLKSIFGFSVKDIAITSAVATAAIGFAFQDTLVNIIAGISIVLEKNFKIGDAVQLKSGEAGLVLQINWRTTKIRNRRNQVVMIPNKELASGEIVNYSYYPQIARIFKVGISYHNSPAYVKKAILEYLKTFPDVLAFPAAEVFVKDFQDFYIEYEVRFFVDDFTQALQIEDKIKTGLWYLFKRKGIEIPFPVRQVILKEKEEEGYQKPEELMFMPGENIFQVVKKSRVVQILKGDLKLVNEKNHVTLKDYSSGDLFYLSEALEQAARDRFSLLPYKEVILKVIFPETLSKGELEALLIKEEELRSFLQAEIKNQESPDLKKEENFIEHFLNINFNKDKKTEKDKEA